MDPHIAEALTPFVLTTRRNHQWLHLDAPLGMELSVFDIDEPAHSPFGLLLNYTNQLAFGGETNMGMPLWVMLDCGIMPSAIVGFALPREVISDRLRDELAVPDKYAGWVPVSEYCACPALEPGCVSGFSLQSQLGGYGLGTRTKALALRIYGSTSQIGVTQFDNPSIRVHARFGALEIMIHRPALHTHPRKSFSYRTQLPSYAVLEAMARGEEAQTSELVGVDGRAFTFDPEEEAHHEMLRAHLTMGKRAWIVPPGWRKDGERGVVEMVLARRVTREGS
ncbi:MAG: hypothetical protein AAGI01_17455 [Myxococcota bacterium]